MLKKKDNDIAKEEKKGSQSWNLLLTATPLQVKYHTGLIHICAGNADGLGNTRQQELYHFPNFLMLNIIFIFQTVLCLWKHI
jgi:hypothetical protein